MLGVTKGDTKSLDYSLCVVFGLLQSLHRNLLLVWRSVLGVSSAFGQLGMKERILIVVPI